MLDILFFVLFCIHNSKIARSKGLNPTSWVLRTIAAMFGGIFLGSFFITIGYKGGMDIVSAQRYLFQNPLKLITLYALEIGGGLLVKFILEKKPDVGNQSDIES